jgi:UDP-N-acetylglucosamine 4,6-dehydratase
MKDISSLVARRPFDQPVVDLDGKSVLITGGTGGFGRAFVERVCRDYRPERLIVFSRDELKQFEMAHELGDRFPFVKFAIGDVRDADRVEEATKGVDVIIHAAALKHVPIAERNPAECLRTNVDGAINIARAAIRNRVSRVCSISTDKAVNPVNVYGASKLAAEKVVSAAALDAGRDGPLFCSVRYGNVVGSRGSVIPFFERLIAEGADELPITDPRMTRFWITMPQAVSFTLSSLQMTFGGEVFVPKIPTMSMLDIARTLAPDLGARVIGIRPGEKLHEVLISVDDVQNTIELNDRFALLSPEHFDSRLRHMANGAHPVAEDFVYASNLNPEIIRAPASAPMRPVKPRIVSA